MEEDTIERQERGAEPSADIARRFVRITQRRRDGYVEFQFSIHHPELFVELILPEHAFEEFCTRNRVMLLDPL